MLQLLLTQQLYRILIDAETIEDYYAFSAVQIFQYHSDASYFDQLCLHGYQHGTSAFGVSLSAILEPQRLFTTNL